jgi:hypothetical protein
MSRRAAASRPAKPASVGAKSAWVQGLGLGALAVAAPGVAVLACLLLLPGLVAMAVAGPGWRVEARSVLLAGIAAAIAPLLALWHDGTGLDGAAQLLGRGEALPLAWGAAGLAWLLAEAVPLVLAAILEALAASQLARLREEHAALAAAWNLPAPLPPPASPLSASPASPPAARPAASSRPPAITPRPG